MTKKRLLRATGAATIAAALAGSFAATPAPVSALECSAVPSSLQGDPLKAEGFTVESTQKLYRFQERPWARVPTGVSLKLRTPAGVTEADLHRALRCAADANSLLAVPGAALRIQRVGDAYEVNVTSKSRDGALELQRRVEAL